MAGLLMGEHRANLRRMQILPKDHNMKALHVALVAGAFSICAEAPVQAANALAGKWTITKADDAPWSNDKDYQPFRKAVPEYVGKHVTFAAKRIKGPSLLACAKPHYEMKDYGADTLFQGQLGE